MANLQNGATTSTQVGNYNTYVGARYVPIIYGEWNKNVNYEPLTIVIHEGNSYTSKTYVPAGVEIDNETYWVQTGNFNGQIAQMGMVIQTLSDSIKEVNSEINNVKKTVGVENKKILVLSDSYGLQSTSPERYSWVTSLTNLMSNWSITNISEAGIGFNRQNHENVLEIFQKYVASTSESTRNEFTDVIVAMGANDMTGYSTSNLFNKVVEAVNYIKANFANAKVSVSFIGNSINKNDTVVGYKLSAYQQYKEGSIVAGANFLDNVYQVTCDQSMMLDEFNHPNQKGADNIAQGIAIELSGSSFKHINWTLQNVTLLPEGATGENAIMFQWIMGDLSYIMFTASKLSGLPTSGNTVNLGQINDPLIYGNSLGIYSAPGYNISDGKPVILLYRWSKDVLIMDGATQNINGSYQRPVIMSGPTILN